MTFGATLKQLREARRVSQSKLGERAGFDHSYVSRLETGARFPRREAVTRLADALEATPAERDQLLESAGFLGERDPDIEAFRQFTPALRRSVLDMLVQLRQST